MPMSARSEERVRVAVMAVAGVLAGVAAGFATTWWHAPAYGWGVAALTFSVLAWRSITGANATDTRSHATGESPSLRARQVFLLVSSIFSLAAIVLLLFHAQAEGGVTAILEAVVALAVVVASWVQVHMVYTLRYASVHYDEDDDGTVDFPGTEEPRYLDFAYLAFTVGMTYAASDMSFTGSEMRRTALTHALYSFMFGTVILAMVVNLAVSVI
jgi:uncharacterized membrane protein